MSSDPLRHHPDLPLPVAIRRIATARVMRLRIDADGTRLKLTIPRRVTDRSALRWASEQQPWVVQQLARRPAGIPLVPGAVVPFEGEELTLVHRPDATRSVQRDGNLLVAGGPAEGFDRRIASWLRRAARDRLSEDVAATARAAGVTIASVSIGDPVSRWGSCSSSGALRFSWRLILAAPHVRRYVVAHEVAHRLHMNHGPDFRRAEKALFGGDVRAASAELKRSAARLRAVGRR